MPTSAQQSSLSVYTPRPLHPTSWQPAQALPSAHLPLLHSPLPFQCALNSSRAGCVFLTLQRACGSGGLGLSLTAGLLRWYDMVLVPRGLKGAAGRKSQCLRPHLLFLEDFRSYRGLPGTFHRYRGRTGFCRNWKGAFPGGSSARLCLQQQPLPARLGSPRLSWASHGDTPGSCEGAPNLAH